MNKFSILFENSEILLVNKPFGVAVQGGKGIAHPLDEELSMQLGYKIHLVHRLDKETSGILIVAKNAKAAAKWTNLISTKAVQKEYTAVCLGEPSVNGRKAKSGKLCDVVEAHGRSQEAVLYFDVASVAEVAVDGAEDGAGAGDGAGTTKVSGAVAGEKIKLSLVKIKLGTGRMHQIRIQLAKAQCPIAADDQHGAFKLNKKIRKLGIKKLHLAATKLTLPVDGKDMTFTIPLPEHMQNTVDTFFCS